MSDITITMSEEDWRALLLTGAYVSNPELRMAAAKAHAKAVGLLDRELMKRMKGGDQCGVKYG